MIPLNEFRPVRRLETPDETRLTPRFPVIDAHNHLDHTRDHAAVAASLERYGIRHIISLDGYPDHRTEEQLTNYVERYPGKFSLFIRADYARLEESDFVKAVDERLRRYLDRGITGVKVHKDVGLTLRLRDGSFLKPDDDRLRPIWESAAKYDLPVLIHIADPPSFFDPVIDARHERYEELAAHPEWSFGNTGCPRFPELMESQERLLEQNPDTTFIIAHIGSHAENLAEVGHMLDRHPNMYIDTAERIAELGRQPYTAREFLVQYQDRILYGTDLIPKDANISGNYRFFETRDEYFPYNDFDEHNQGRWNIYGVDLPDEVLRKIYGENALRVIPRLRKML